MTPRDTIAQTKIGSLAHVIAEMLERAGEQRPNGDILHDILAQVLPAAEYTIVADVEKAVDDVAARLWRAEAEDSGSPASVAAGRTREAFNGQSEDLKNRWRRLARAALSAASPHMPVPAGWVLVPEGDPVTLDDCPEGLFMFGDTIAMMTEYATMSRTVPPMRQRDAYIVESGEYFWGGTSRTMDRAKLMVQPLSSRPKGGA